MKLLMLVGCRMTVMNNVLQVTAASVDKIWALIRGKWGKLRVCVCVRFRCTKSNRKNELVVC